MFGWTLKCVVNEIVPSVDEGSEMDSDLDEEMEESDEPLAKREKAETEVIQVLQVGAMEDGSSTVVGVVQPNMLSALPPSAGDHILSSTGTSTIRHCGSVGNMYASVWSAVLSPSVLSLVRTL